MRTGRALLLALCALLPTQSSAQALDLQRGRALHQMFCSRCHGIDLYTRSGRRAESFDALRRWVYWWAIDARLGWSRLEIDDVSHYLNERFYHFPCGDSEC
jgi:mono/diheme cytochrome c family protein